MGASRIPSLLEICIFHYKNRPREGFGAPHGTKDFMCLLLAVVNVGVAAAAIGVVDEAERRVVQLRKLARIRPICKHKNYAEVTSYRAPEVVATALPIELASTVVDVGGAVAIHP